MKFAIGAGGTGGHIIPAIALANELRSRGHECFFIGNSNSMEQRLSSAEGYQFFEIKVQKLYRKLSIENILFPYLLMKSIFKCLGTVKRQGPDAVIVTGGFVSGPTAIAAVLSRTICFLHESNSYPGLTTRMLAPYLTRIYISFEDTRKYLPMNKLRNFGIPLKEKNDTQVVDYQQLGLQEGAKTLLITGGSQGSLAINEAISQITPSLLESGWQIIWQTGAITYEKFNVQYKETPGVYIFDFTPLMPQLMNLATLAITRAGAMTIAELEATELPSILIPLPTAAENHQYFNALAQEKKGVAVLIQQDALSSEKLLHTIRNIDLVALRQKLTLLPKTNASENIVDNILSYFKEIRYAR